MATKTKWTPEMVSRLHELRDRNWTVLEIAQEMGLPFEVVKSKIGNEKTKAKKAEKGFTFKLNPEPEPNTTPFSEPETTATEQPEPLLTKAEAASIADFSRGNTLEPLFNSYGAPLVFPGFDAREDRPDA